MYDNTFLHPEKICGDTSTGLYEFLRPLPDLTATDHISVTHLHLHPPESNILAKSSPPIVDQYCTTPDEKFTMFPHSCDAIIYLWS